MKLFKKTLNEIPENRLLPDYVFKDLSWAVLDIETLGLSPAKSQCILCGTVTEENGELISRQFFAEGIKTYWPEQEMLEALEDALADTDIIITYNGRSFDEPFIEKRREIMRMGPSKKRYSLDLYTWVRNYSDLKNFLPNLQQTTVEDYAGLWEFRKDEISGRESIALYYDYVLTNSRDSLDKILLHNADDIAQLYRLISIMKKTSPDAALFQTGMPVRTGRGLVITDGIRFRSGHMVCGGEVNGPCMDYVNFGDDSASLELRNDKLDLSIPVTEYMGLSLADIREMDLPELESKSKEGFLVLASGDGINHRNCNMLVQQLLYRHLGKE